jgi:CheY-like chemotaxis protein
LAEIRSDETLCDIPVVVMTSSREHEEMIRSENLQVEDYLMKPIDRKLFLDLVRRLKTHWHTDVILPVTE